MRIDLLVICVAYLVGCANSKSFSVFDNVDEFEKGDLLRNDDEDFDEIIGGITASTGEFPYLAIMTIDGQRWCGGTLIGPSHVLTAAHCFADPDIQPPIKPSSLGVRVNTTSWKGGAGSVFRTVRKYVAHSQYNYSTNDNDIALIALSSPITNVKLAKLPQSTSSTYAGKEAIIAGWGDTISGSQKGSEKLLKATVTVLDNAVCAKQYAQLINTPHFGPINNNKICAFAPGKDTCQGDSGGPIFVDGVQVGVTSYGYDCAHAQYPGVYARVTTYLNWIKSTQVSM